MPHEQQMMNYTSGTFTTVPINDGWRSMDSAPHDGTIIEVRCTYGVAPWYGLFYWTNGVERTTFQGQQIELHGQPRWAKVNEPQSSFSDDPTFSWRPYTGSAQTYVDPTGGAQDTEQYWRRAAARKSGLPANTFEPSLFSKFKNWIFS
jgi:hypothetical protein